MLKLTEIEMGKDYRHGYDPGCKPGIGCKITFQHGKMSYETLTIELPPEAVKRVVDLAISEAMAIFKIDETSVDIEGHAGVVEEPKPGDPEPSQEPEI